jgi:hypothetical protein
MVCDTILINFPKLIKKQIEVCAQGKDIGQPMRISVGETI